MEEHPPYFTKHRPAGLFPYWIKHFPDGSSRPATPEEEYELLKNERKDELRKAEERVPATKGDIERVLAAIAELKQRMGG